MANHQNMFLSVRMLAVVPRDIIHQSEIPFLPQRIGAIQWAARATGRNV